MKRTATFMAALCLILASLAPLASCARPMGQLGGAELLDLGEFTLNAWINADTRRRRQPRRTAGKLSRSRLIRRAFGFGRRHSNRHNAMKRKRSETAKHNLFRIA
jgi:hypothetical protein